MEIGNRHQLSELYTRLQILCGAASLLFSVSRLRAEHLDFHFLLLVIITLTIGSRITVRIPRLDSQISVSDTFLLLSIPLCGGEAAVLLAALDGFCSTLRIGRRKITYLLNVSVMAVSTFVTAWVTRLWMGTPEVGLAQADTRTFIIALCLMGVTQYVVNSGLVATGLALKTSQPVWQTWRKYFLWTSITYFVGAAAAGLIIKLISVAGFIAFLVATPIIAVVYLTYQTYLRNIETAERHVAALQESEGRFRSSSTTPSTTRSRACPTAPSSSTA